MLKEKDSCVQPAGGPILTGDASSGEHTSGKEEPIMSIARVGQEAPDFEAAAYVAGEGFKNIKLSNYRGKWVVLCFYPGDFTFV